MVIWRVLTGMRWALVLTLLAAGLPSVAGMTDLQVRHEGDITTVEVLFSSELRLHESDVDETQPTDQFTVELVPLDQAEYSDWSSSMMTLDEADHEVASVTLEGNARSGVRLLVQLRNRAHVQVLPQYTQSHVLFKLSSPKVHKQLARQSKKADLSRYTVTLESRSGGTVGLQDVPPNLAAQHIVYVVPFEKDGQTWQRLRLGFWESEQAARAARARVVDRYPDAWVSRVTTDEEAYAEAYKLNPSIGLERAGLIDPGPSADNVRVEVAAVTPSTIREDTTPAPPQPTPRQPPEQETDPRIQEADEAFIGGDFARAVALLTQLAAQPGAEAQKALEKLGMARQANGQLAHAMKIYRDYIERYPDTEGAARVQQRLSTMSAITAAAPRQLRRAATRSEQWRYFRNLSQFYRRHSLEVNGTQSVPIDGVFTDVNLMARKTGGVIDHEGRVTFTHLYDFTGRLEDRDLRISSAYWDSYIPNWSTGIRVGRQSKYDAGVIGRFDGLVAEHDLNDQFEVGLVGGFLLDSSFDAPSTDRPFYGLYGSYTSKSGSTRVTPFVLQQSYDGITDRQAVGVRAQWTRDTNVVMGLADYDLHHAVLNNASIVANVGVGRQSSFNLSFDQRRSPYVTTRNALIGQPFSDLSELEQELIDLTLEDLAADRAATTRSARLGWNHRLSDHWEFTTNVTASDISGTETSMNVVGFEARRDTYYSMQVRAVDPFGQSTYSGLLVRYADSETAETTSIYWNSRLNLMASWWLYPRVRIDHRAYHQTDQTQVSIVPSIRVDYRRSNRLRFELEAGYQTTSRETVTADIDISGLFVRAGYRASF